MCIRDRSYCDNTSQYGHMSVDKLKVRCAAAQPARPSATVRALRNPAVLRARQAGAPIAGTLYFILSDELLAEYRAVLLRPASTPLTTTLVSTRATSVTGAARDRW